MGKVLGIGGLFFRAADPAATRDWYARVLGIDFAGWGGAIFRPQDAASQPGAATVFSPFAADSDYFAPSTAEFMLNLMVDDLDAMLARCAAEGVDVLATMPDEGNGRFAHLIDIDGRKLELWEPKPMA